MRNNFAIVLTALLFITACGTTNNVTSNGPLAYATKTGIAAAGSGMSQNEKAAYSIATRKARANLVSCLNSAIASIYNESGVTSDIPVEYEIKGSKVINSSISIRKGAVTATVTVEIKNEELVQWSDSFYNNIPKEDPLLALMSQEEFKTAIYKHLHINN